MIWIYIKKKEDRRDYRSDKLKVGDKITIDFSEKGKIEATVVNVIKYTNEIILKTEEGEFFFVYRQND